MHIVVVNNHTSHLHTFHKLFGVNTYFTYISYRQVGGYDFRPFDCIILTGSNNHTYMNKMFAKEIHIIKELSKPILGICLGCELIAEAHGGIIARNQERIEGDLEISCVGDNRLHHVHEAHRYAIIELGNDLEGLAKSAYGYEIITHKTKPILGFQFHPEVTVPFNDGQTLFMQYRNHLGLGENI